MFERPASRKVWICLYTCCVTRAAHLDIVPNMTADSSLFQMLYCKERLSRQIRVRQCDKAVAKMVKTIMEMSVVTNPFSDIGVKWAFNLERAPWWGGY